MNTFIVPIEKPFKYVYTGKFEAPDEKWIHIYRNLLDFELIIVTNKTLYIAINGERLVLGPGDFVLYSPNSVQKGYKPSDCSFYWLHFELPENENYYELAHTKTMPYDKSSYVSLPQKGHINNYDRLIVMMKQLQDSIRYYNDPFLNDYLTTSIVLSFANICATEFNIDKQSELKHHQLINDVIDYIAWNMETNIKVKDIAKHFGYNPKYLSNLFATEKGVSLKQFIIQNKINRAKFLLTDTNDTIAEISGQLGYSDSYNFMKLFKNKTGMTPTEYRNTYDKRMLFYI